MRDFLIVGMVAAALPFALVHTWMGVLLWTWLSIMNPHKLTYGFAYSAPLAAMAAGATLLSMIVTRDRLRMTWSPPVVLVVVFVLWMCLTTLMSPSPEAAWPQLNKVLKIQLMTLVAIAALQQRKHIELFVWVMVLSIGFYGVKGGIWTLLTGGGSRVWGPPGGFFEDNNALGATLVIAIPLMNYLRLVSTRSWVRKAVMAMIVLCAVAALGTQSRGAMLAISAMGFFLWLRSPRKLVTGAVVLGLGAMIISFMPSTWDERMNTINTYEEDGSAMSRLRSWNFTVNLANHKPFGGGFDVYTDENYAAYSDIPGKAFVAHSIYFSVLGEHGYVGLALFLLIWLATFRLIGKIRKRCKDRKELDWVLHLASMCQVSLIGYAVGGSFLSLAYFDLPYNILVVLVAANRWIDARGWETEGVGAFGASHPARDRQAVAGGALARW